MLEYKKIIKNSRFSVLCQSIFSQLQSFKINAQLKKENIVFIWIPKTSGKSVFKTLETEINMQKRKKKKFFLSFPNKGAVTFGHVSYLSLLSLGVISTKYHSNAYKFCIVRNPYSRAISLYNYFVQEKIINHNFEFEAFLDRVHLNRPPIGLYNSIGISQSNPQSDWIVGSDGKLLINDFFKLEEIDKFKSLIENKFRRKFSFQKINVSKKKITFDDISRNKCILEKIELIYSRDFELFNYDKISSKI